MISLWNQLKDDWPQALCWGMTLVILWGTLVLGTANWIVYTFGLSHREPRALPWELVNSLVLGLLGMKGLNILQDGKRTTATTSK